MKATTVRTKATTTKQKKAKDAVANEVLDERGESVIPFPFGEITDEDTALDWWEQTFATSCEELSIRADAATLVRAVVSSLQEIRAASLDRTLSLTEAAQETGYSPKQVGRWVRSGQIVNAGTDSAPRVRRKDVLLRRKRTLPRPAPVRIVESAQDIARSVANSHRRVDDG